MVREDIRHTAIMDRVGTWAIPDTNAIFEFDHEETPDADPEASGHTFAPILFHLKNRIGIRVMYNNSSPYEIRYEGSGQYRLYRDSDAMDEVFFPPKPEEEAWETGQASPRAKAMG